jgi:hypothetical protein
LPLNKIGQSIEHHWGDKIQHLPLEGAATLAYAIHMWNLTFEEAATFLEGYLRLLFLFFGLDPCDDLFLSGDSLSGWRGVGPVSMGYRLGELRLPGLALGCAAGFVAVHTAGEPPAAAGAPFGPARNPVALAGKRRV